MEKRKIYFEWFKQRSNKGKYRYFQLIPALSFIIDSQLEEGITDIYEGYVGYELWLSWLGFEAGVQMNIKTGKYRKSKTI